MNEFARVQYTDFTFQRGSRVCRIIVNKFELPYRHRNVIFAHNSIAMSRVTTKRLSAFKTMADPERGELKVTPDRMILFTSTFIHVTIRFLSEHFVLNVSRPPLCYTE